MKRRTLRERANLWYWRCSRLSELGDQDAITLAWKAGFRAAQRERRRAKP